MLPRLIAAASWLVLLVAGAVAAQAPTPGAPIRMYVAASTHEAVVAIAEKFQRRSGFPVEISPGPSSKLAKQIVEGAPADLFLSADHANADYLTEKGRVTERRNLLGNRLVVVVPTASRAKVESLADLTKDDIKELALALDKVPAGEYARQALRAGGVWEQVEKKVIGGDDVRATLAFVESGASAGVVYFTDAVGNSKVRVAFEIDPSLHWPIEYPLILLKGASAHPSAIALFDYLRSEEAVAEFQRAKFRVLP